MHRCPALVRHIRPQRPGPGWNHPIGHRGQPGQHQGLRHRPGPDRSGQLGLRHGGLPRLIHPGAPALDQTGPPFSGCSAEVCPGPLDMCAYTATWRLGFWVAHVLCVGPRNSSSTLGPQVLPLAHAYCQSGRSTVRSLGPPGASSPSAGWWGWPAALTPPASPSRRARIMTVGPVSANQQPDWSATARGSSRSGWPASPGHWPPQGVPAAGAC